VLVFEAFFSPPMPLLMIARTMPIYFLQVDAGVLHRHFRRGHGQMRVAIGPADILRIIEIVLRFEIVDFAGDRQSYALVSNE